MLVQLLTLWHVYLQSVLLATEARHAAPIVVAPSECHQPFLSRFTVRLALREITNVAYIRLWRSHCVVPLHKNCLADDAMTVDGCSTSTHPQITHRKQLLVISIRPHSVLNTYLTCHPRQTHPNVVFLSQVVIDWQIRGWSNSPSVWRAALNTWISHWSVWLVDK